jgi:hypothetical protein
VLLRALAARSVLHAHPFRHGQLVLAPVVVEAQAVVAERAVMQLRPIFRRRATVQGKAMAAPLRAFGAPTLPTRQALPHLSARRPSSASYFEASTSAEVDTAVMEAAWLLRAAYLLCFFFAPHLLLLVLPYLLVQSTAGAALLASTPDAPPMVTHPAEKAPSKQELLNWEPMRRLKEQDLPVLTAAPTPQHGLNDAHVLLLDDVQSWLQSATGVSD